MVASQCIPGMPSRNSGSEARAFEEIISPERFSRLSMRTSHAVKSAFVWIQISSNRERERKLGSLFSNH